jgi:hypothetical protein
VGVGVCWIDLFDTLVVFIQKISVKGLLSGGKREREVRTLYQNVEFCLFSAGKAGWTYTGSRVSEIRAKLRWRLKARYHRGSRGPKTSMESKDGKRATAQFVGGEAWEWVNDELCCSNGCGVRRGKESYLRLDSGAGSISARADTCWEKAVVAKRNGVMMKNLIL